MEERGKEKKISNVTADMTAAIVALLIGLAIFGAFINDILSLYNSFLENLYSGDFTKVKNWVTAILLPLDILLIGWMVFTLRRYTSLTRGTLIPPQIKEEEIKPPLEEASGRWEEIRKLANSNNPSEWNMAILRADALVGEVLQSLGYQGTTVAERLKVVDPTKMPSLERIWSAHRLRNMIAHDPLEQHTKETIINALRSYEQALRELGAFRGEREENTEENGGAI